MAVPAYDLADGDLAIGIEIRHSPGVGIMTQPSLSPTELGRPAQSHSMAPRVQDPIFGESTTMVATAGNPLHDGDGGGGDEEEEEEEDHIG